MSHLLLEANVQDAVSLVDDETLQVLVHEGGRVLYNIPGDTARSEIGGSDLVRSVLDRSDIAKSDIAKSDMARSDMVTHARTTAHSMGHYIGIPTNHVSVVKLGRVFVLFSRLAQ